MNLLRWIFTLGIFFLLAMMATPQLTASAETDPVSPYLVRDIYPGLANSQPRTLIAFQNKLFFIADDGIHGREWWSTNGKENTTNLFLDMIPGTEGAFPYSVEALTTNNQLFFPGYDSEHGREMWVSDGSPAGTHMITDLFPGSVEKDLWVFATFKNEAYFASGYYDCEHKSLWKTDGTESGTILIHDTDAGISDCDARYMTFSHTNDQLLFGLEMIPSGGYSAVFEVWKTNGTLVGTAKVKEFFPGYQEYHSMESLSDLTFIAYGSHTSPTQIYQTDGTEAGTKKIYYANYPYYRVVLAPVGDWIYFAAVDDQNNYGIMRTQGLGKFESVKAFNEVKESQQPRYLQDFYGKLLFSVDNSDGQHLWISDGTEVGTYELTGASGSDYHDPLNMTTFDGKVYFSAEDDVHGRELWVADGTAGGTRLVGDINPGVGSSNPEQLTVANGTLYFSADDGTHGIELWAYNPFPHKIYVPTILR